MTWWVGITLDQLGWCFSTRRIQSPDQFTARMIDKYGRAFYDAWTPREQDRYATLRLREEAGIQYPRRPLVPRAAFLASLVACPGAARADAPRLGLGAIAGQRRWRQRAGDGLDERVHQHLIMAREVNPAGALQRAGAVGLVGGSGGRRAPLHR